MVETRRVADIFKALSVETRVRILERVKGGALCVNALARRLGVTPAAVSQHLRILRAAGLVVPEKCGYYVHYRVNEETLAEWRALTARALSPEPVGSCNKVNRSCAAKKKSAGSPKP